jgi:hypothetical protein
MNKADNMQDWNAKSINTYKQIYGYSMGDDMADKKTVEHAKNVIASVISSNDKDTKSLQLSDQLYNDILNVIEGDKYVGRISVVSALGTLDLVKFDLMQTMITSGDEQV